MLGKLRPRSVYDVMAAIACFGVLAGGTAYAANTIRTGDIVDNEVFTTDVRDDTLGFGGLFHQDLAAGSVRSSEVANGTLNDEDVGQGTFVNFAADIGLVSPNSCVYKDITGINAQGDHLLLTPSNNDSFLMYSIQYRSGQEFARLQVCNPFSFTANDEITHFNLLVIDAQ